MYNVHEIMFNKSNQFFKSVESRLFSSLAIYHGNGIMKDNLTFFVIN